MAPYLDRLSARARIVRLAILEGEDPAIADGDAKDVRSEVFEGGGACAYRLRVNDPIFAPDLLIKEMEEIALFEQVLEPGAEEDRERLDVNEEILPGLECNSLNST
jgi:hypothetical protein